jgi:drug/metabolite transporter (DMT)-like permease
VLSKVELSFVYPFLSIAFIAVAIGSWMFFGEDINGWRILGFGFICIGTVLVAQSATENTVATSNISKSDSVLIEGSKS